MRNLNSHIWYKFSEIIIIDFRENYIPMLLAYFH